MAVAGRLDINTTGLLLFTQDGSIASHIIHHESMVEKEYLVRLSAPMSYIQGNNIKYDYDYHHYYNIHKDSAIEELQDKVEILRRGINCSGDLLMAKSIDILHEQNQQLRIILTCGKKHHIRRMMESVSLNVQALKRVRIGNITLGPLPTGKWRYLSPNESI
jgi:23S rRNA pseudouridine2604 synthase